MGTEVLLPQDFLGVSPPAFHRRRSSFLAGNGFISSKPNNRKTHNLYRTEHMDRKRKPIKESRHLQRKPAGNISSPLSHRKSSTAEDLLQTQVNNPEVEPGRVTILRRGQSLESFERNLRNEATNIKTRNGSENNLNLNIMNTTTSDVYAGSCFFVSPSPNSLPLPSFFSNKKSESDVCATRDLRRLLGIEK